MDQNVANKIRWQEKELGVQSKVLLRGTTRPAGPLTLDHEAMERQVVPVSQGLREREQAVPDPEPQPVIELPNRIVTADGPACHRDRAIGGPKGDAWSSPVGTIRDRP